ncbi:lytic transglycosylase [Salinivibrio proteolyticus]|uniref:LysM peptidoglycan-binding domain-containing protein n=1 Tax=Salinivibrio proteolyticus TaxID=334715 RepID=A0ABY7LE81_9GAMM|nr:LysM peptidoglycan-binding domain-containing protein [Salinivibrio proteolyticus]WBA15403.1 LysM peptidoglycan-binding domain-containing protein [Salinivibrio proteolyticus]
MKYRFVILSTLLLSGCQLTGDAQNTDIATKKTPVAATPVKATPTVSATKKQPTPATPTVLSPQMQEDVWQRISMQLSLPVPNNSAIRQYRNWYLKYPNHIATVAERATPFLHLIVEKVEARNMPLEIALLPIVESSFDQFAYSHGRAAGLWQFVPATGERFGLEQNWWYDGRRDVAKATDAALDYLEYLNGMFDGNWLHAIAAYNSGEGRVARAIRNNEKRGKPIDFWHLDLPKETSSYVPKLIALGDVIRHKDKYGLEVPAIANKPALALVEPNIQMDLALAANYAGLSVSELQSLNPAYNHWATAPAGPTHLLLPIDKVDRFNTELAKNNNQGLRVERYYVQSGDSLSEIAAHYNTTVKVLQRANQLSTTRIRVGQPLMIPVSLKDESQYTLSAPQRLAALQAAERDGYKRTHTVRKGDSFWTIARRYDVDYRQLAKWNGMSPRDTLSIGQKLVVWDKNDNAKRVRTITYQIRQGDSLSSIAQRYNVSVSDLVKWNQLRKNAYIQPGQRLTLHIDISRSSGS